MEGSYCSPLFGYTTIGFNVACLSTRTTNSAQMEKVKKGFT
jgi:hypothetical protein